MNLVENALRFYYDAIKLKDKVRSGWNAEHWNIIGRRESVAEHIYGTQMLAMAIYYNFNLEKSIDIYKVNTMLALHETEEIRMPDFTPFEYISNEERKITGLKSVSETCKSLSKPKGIIDIINEFNERKTKEARYAYFCDKLECDLQAKKYSDDYECSIDDAGDKVLSDKKVQEIIKEGYETVADIFIEYDRFRYGNTIFKFILDYVQNIDINCI